MTETENARLVRIETKLDAYLISTVDHEARLRKVEARQSALFGGGSLIAALLSICISLIGAGVV